MLLLGTGVDSLSAPVVTGGYDPNAIDFGAVRWRNFANFADDREIRIGLIPLTPGGTFDVGDYVWSAGDLTHVTVTYDGTVTLATAVGGVPDVFTYTLASTPLGPVNYLRIDLCNSSQSVVALLGVTLDGESLGDFGPPAGCDAWSITGIDKSGGFTLEGDIQFSSFQSAFDQSLIQVRFGNTSAVPAPAAGWLLATGIAGLGGRRLRRKSSLGL